MQYLGKFLAAAALAYLTLSGIVCADTLDTESSNNLISSPKETYPLLYTVNSQYGILVKSVNGYHITFHDVSEKISFKNSADKTGVVDVKEFVKFLQNKSVILKADVTGVINSTTKKGQSPFYASFTLSKPVLSTHDNILRFEAEPFKNTQLALGKSTRFNNATIFINGCGVCACDVNHENCV